MITTCIIYIFSCDLQWSSEFKNLNCAAECHQEENFIEMLNKCHESFVKDNINCRIAINFFKEHVDKTFLHQER